MRGTYELKLDRKRTSWNKGLKFCWSDEHRARQAAAVKRSNTGKPYSRRVPIVVEDTNGRRYFFPCLKLSAAAIGRTRYMLTLVLAGKKKLGHELTGYKIYRIKKI